MKGKSPSWSPSLWYSINSCYFSVCYIFTLQCFPNPFHLPGCCASACPAHPSQSCYCPQTTQAAPQLTHLHPSLKRAGIRSLIGWSADRQLSLANNFQGFIWYKGAAQLSAPKTSGISPFSAWLTGLGLI